MGDRELKYYFSKCSKIFNKCYYFNYLMAQWSSMNLEVSRIIERIKIFLYLDQK